MEKKVLGRGLEALIPKKEPPRAQKEYTYIDIEKLRLSEYQSRTDLKEAELKELADSIKSKGIIQPLIVREKGGFYEIVAGSRRYHASKSLGIKELPVIIRDLQDRDALVFSVIENLQRQDLNPVEEAECFKRLMEEFGLSAEEVSRMLGKDRTTVVNILRLLNLPDVIQQALREGRITASGARTLLGLDSEKEQLELFGQLLKEKVSVRNLEEVVRRKKLSKGALEPYFKEAEDNLQKVLGRKIKIMPRGKRGRLVIEYYSQEDLENLMQLLTGIRETGKGVIERPDMPAEE